MKGYYLSEEKFKGLNLIKNPDIATNMDKTVIVLTENDFKIVNPDIELNEILFTEFAEWFYKNYYQSIIEGFWENVRIQK